MPKAEALTELEGKGRKKEHVPGKKKVIKRNIGNRYSTFSEERTGRRGKAAVQWKCTDAWNSGKNHYVLLMVVIKSKPTIQMGDKEGQTSWKRI